MDEERTRIAVVVPCYKVTRHIGAVLSAMGPEVWRIYCVDDCCPEKSGDFIERTAADPRVTVLRHEQNQGVGGAVITGYRRALADGATVVVKIDGDGQMDPRLVPLFVQPIAAGHADYTKGNRFFNLSGLKTMPGARVFGNTALSFLAKLSSGYWNVFDPTNGYTAIHASVLAELPFDRLAKRYFFESDMLFRLNLLGAVVLDVPMRAVYGDEISNLRIGAVIPNFIGRSLKNFAKRIVYSYFVHDFNLASLEMVVGLLLLIAGTLFGGYEWIKNARAGTVSSAGTVMLAALPVIAGLQLLLGAIGIDVQSVPRAPLHPRLLAIRPRPMIPTSA